MAMPNLFIPGAAKSGTSSLHEYLSQHPQVYMSKIKEPHFFARPEFPKGLDEYKELFAPGSMLAYRGESSTSYMVYPDVIGRILAYVENPKFIFILRNPVDRAISHYWWLKGMGYESRSLYEAIVFDKQNHVDPVKDLVGNFSRHYYYHMGCYAKWLRPFWEVFGKNAVHITTLEKLHDNPLDAVNAIFSFLGIAEMDRVGPVEVNKTAILRYPGLYSFLAHLGWGDSIGRFIKSFLPVRAYQTVSGARRKFLDWLKIKFANESYSEADESTRSWLIKMYIEQVRDLRQMTGMGFSEWRQDFPVHGETGQLA